MRRRDDGEPDPIAEAAATPDEPWTPEEWGPDSWFTAEAAERRAERLRRERRHAT